VLTRFASLHVDATSADTTPSEGRGRVVIANSSRKAPDRHSTSSELRNLRKLVCVASMLSRGHTKEGACKVEAGQVKSDMHVHDALEWRA
jgi:hypothetical protein